jgi:GMP synthase-like glutamine amidotransferase
LIASALGARVYPNTQKEIGWFPVKKTSAGSSSNLFGKLPERFMAFHWHGDTFDLPAGAEWLAESDACRHQAFTYRAAVLGLQFHLEAEAANIDLLIEHCGHEIMQAPFIQPAARIREQIDLCKESNARMHTLLSEMEQRTG